MGLQITFEFFIHKKFKDAILHNEEASGFVTRFIYKLAFIYLTHEHMRSDIFPSLMKMCTVIYC